MKKVCLIVLFGCCLSFLNSFSQSQPSADIKKIIGSFDAMQVKLPVERLYLHTDRPYYSSNDTLWFKAYLFEGPFLKGSSKSGILYAELSDSGNKVIKRFKFPVANGMGLGNIHLDQKDFKGGKYVLRAYTRWMLNFDTDFLFEKDIYISGNLGSGNDKGAISALNSDSVDVQFLPEGGDMLSGIVNKVAFKAIGKDGRGINVKGEIKDSQNNTIAKFESAYRGMGEFEIVPESGKKYRAVLTSPVRGMEVPLPLAKEEGFALTVTDVNQDSLIVSLLARGDTRIVESKYFLIGHARGLVCFAANINLKGESAIREKISKDQFPSGVTRFTLFDSNYQPLNERAVYINHADALKIGVQEHIFIDSASLTLDVTDLVKNPIEGVFSLSVTRDSLISIPAFQSNIISRILFEANIKGHIEDPAYYLSGTAEAAKAMDLLMLTQGWTGYSWKQVFNPAVNLRYQPETEFTISGKSMNILTEKPRVNTLVALNAKRPMLYLDTLTGADGSFLFKNIPLTPNDEFLVMAKNANGKDRNVRIEVNEEKAVDLDHLSIKNLFPLVPDAEQIEYNAKVKEFKKKSGLYSADGMNILDEVVIAGKNAVKDSKNKNGPGKADIILGENLLRQTPEMTLLDLLKKNVKGFRLIRGPGVYKYAIYNKPLKLVFDGSDPFYIEQSPEVNYLGNYKAKDVRGIEIMTSVGNVQPYRNWFNPLRGAANMSSTGGIREMLRLGDTIYAEITTYGNIGSTLRQTPGMHVVRTVPFSVPNRFYNPKYTVKEVQPYESFSPLIFWEPWVITSKDGKATVTFHHKNEPGNYTLILEGSDMNGNLGYVRHKFVIKE